MTTWIDEYTQMIDDCEKRESRLTDWEREFLDSIRGRVDQAIPLTPKQTETLDRIWENATRNG